MCPYIIPIVIKDKLRIIIVEYTTAEAIMDEFVRLMRRSLGNPLHQIVMALVASLALVFAGISFFFDVYGIVWISDFLQGISTNMIGALAVFLLVDVFWGEGKELQQIHEELRSRNNVIARAAIEKARMKEMLYDGSLSGLVFSGADWSNSDLSDAKLARSSLTYVNLKGANLSRADLQWTDFSFAQFDESTILPDGTCWTSDYDIERFTKMSRHASTW